MFWNDWHAPKLSCSVPRRSRTPFLYFAAASADSRWDLMRPARLLDISKERYCSDVPFKALWCIHRFSKLWVNSEEQFDCAGCWGTITCVVFTTLVLLVSLKHFPPIADRRVENSHSKEDQIGRDVAWSFENSLSIRTVYILKVFFVTCAGKKYNLSCDNRSCVYIAPFIH